MGESQSRYSIVERLTKQKLDIMGAKSDLQSNIIRAEQDYTSLVKEVENRTEEIKADSERRIRELDREVIRADEKANNLKVRKQDAEAVFDAKIKAINEALVNILDISKTSTS